MTVAVYRLAAASDLGFYSCLLRSRQDSVWSEWGDDVFPPDDCVEEITRGLLSLGCGPGRPQWDLFLEVRDRIARRYEEAGRLRDGILRTMVPCPGRDADARSGLTARVRELAADARVEQVRDWDSLCQLTRGVVANDPRLAAWWHLGFDIAGYGLRPDASTATLHYPAEPEGVVRAVGRLPDPDRGWAEGMLRTWKREYLSHLREAGLRVPVHPGGAGAGETDAGWPEGGTEWISAFKAIREALPAYELDHGGSRVDERQFWHTSDFSKCWWHVTGDLEFDETERVVMRRLFEDFERGGNGVELRVLLAGTPRDHLTRLDNVFFHGGHGRRRYNPAWTAGLIENVRSGQSRQVPGGRYRLNLQGHKRTQKNTAGPT